MDEIAQPESLPAEPPPATKSVAPKTNYDPKIVWDSPVPIKSPITIGIILLVLLFMAAFCVVIYAVVDATMTTPTSMPVYRR